MNKPTISIDTFDIIICVVLIGGFATGQWLPTIFFLILPLIIPSCDD